MMSYEIKIARCSGCQTRQRVSFKKGIGRCCVKRIWIARDERSKVNLLPATRWGKLWRIQDENI